MKATYLTTQGPPDVLQYGDQPDPKIGPGEALIQVGAVALNHLDIWLRSGSGRPRTFTEPFIPGADVAGAIADLAAPTARPELVEGPGLAVGQRVLIDPSLTDNTCDYCQIGQSNLCRNYRMLGFAVNGGYAEYVKAPIENLHPIPDRLSFEEAACLPLTFQTAYHMLVTRAGLRLGDRVLVQAAGSGVGVAAIQIAKALGAWVVTTASSDEKLAKGIALGADAGINYQREPEFSRKVRELTQGEGVDIVIDHIGGEIFQENMKALKRGDHYVNCGRTAGATAEIDLFALLVNHQSIHGSFMGTKKEMREWMRLVRDGRFQGVVGELFALRDAAEAHRRMEARDFFGKLVLTP